PAPPPTVAAPPPAARTDRRHRRAATPLRRWDRIPPASTAPARRRRRRHAAGTAARRAPTWPAPRTAPAPAREFSWLLRRRRRVLLDVRLHRPHEAEEIVDAGKNRHHQRQRQRVD